MIGTSSWTSPLEVVRRPFFFSEDLKFEKESVNDF